MAKQSDICARLSVQGEDESAGNEACMIWYCTVCRNPVPEKRAFRGSAYCRDECRRSHRLWRRTRLAAHRCRLCGRARKRLDTWLPEKSDLSPCASGAQAATGYGRELLCE